MRKTILAIAFVAAGATGAAALPAMDSNNNPWPSGTENVYQGQVRSYSHARAAQAARHDMPFFAAPLAFGGAVATAPFRFGNEVFAGPRMRTSRAMPMTDWDHCVRRDEMTCVH
jgi:hypothetical protein